MSNSDTDSMAIQKLTNHYANLMDRDGWDEWCELWTEDGRFSGPAGEVVGRAKLQEFTQTLMQRTSGKRHIMANAVIDVDGDRAKQECAMLIVDRSESPSLMGTAFYRDELVKVNGKWKFASRSIEFDPNYMSRL